MSKKLLIYGAGEFARLMSFYFHHESDYELAGFCLDADYMTTDRFCTLPVVPFESVQKTCPASEYRMFVAIGYRMMRNRSRMFDKAKDKGYRLVNFISPRAIVRTDLQIGENNVILSSSDIEPFVHIGDNNIFWTRCIIGHGARVGHHNYFSGGVGLGGNCVIGNQCFMGNAALMVNDVHIADETYLVAGAVILRDTEAATRYHGNPARRVSQHKDTGIVIT